MQPLYHDRQRESSDRGGATLLHGRRSHTALRTWVLVAIMHTMQAIPLVVAVQAGAQIVPRLFAVLLVLWRIRVKFAVAETVFVESCRHS
jgi:hypothetical protein